MGNLRKKPVCGLSQCKAEEKSRKRKAALNPFKSMVLMCYSEHFISVRLRGLFRPGSKGD